MIAFIKDDRATMESPLRLVVYIIITGAIVAVAAMGLLNLKPNITANTMEKQIGKIKVSLNTMQYGGARNLIDPASPSGNIRTFKITIPEDVEYLAFGADPDPDNDNNLTNTPEGMLTDRGNVIFYRSRTGGKIRIPLDDRVEFREGLLEDGRWVVNNANGKQYGVVLQGKGTFELTFELVYDPVSAEKYSLSHFTYDFNAYINPYDHAVLPNGIWIFVDKTIPADGVTDAEIIVQLKDKKGRDAPGEGIEINLSASLGNLTSTNVTTDMKGRAATNITSRLAGTALISASSPGLNSGSTYLTIKQAPIIIRFRQWIYGSEKLSANFTTNQDLNFSVSLSGNGTEFWGWPHAGIEIDGAKIGEETVDSGSLVTKDYPQTALHAGTHTLNVRMTDDFWIPLLGDRNLYVENVVLSG